MRLSDLAAAGVVPVWDGCGLLIPLTEATAQSGPPHEAPLWAPENDIGRSLAERAATGRDAGGRGRIGPRHGGTYGRGGVGAVRRKRGEVR